MKQKKPDWQERELRVTFRIPKELAAQVKELTSRERRSLNTQLLILVEKGLAQ